MSDLKKGSNEEKRWDTNFLVKDYGTHSSFLGKAGRHDLFYAFKNPKPLKYTLLFIDLDTVYNIYIIHNYILSFYL